MTEIPLFLFDLQPMLLVEDNHNNKARRPGVHTQMQFSRVDGGPKFNCGYKKEKRDMGLTDKRASTEQSALQEFATKANVKQTMIA